MFHHNKSQSYNIKKIYMRVYVINLFIYEFQSDNNSIAIISR